MHREWNTISTLWLVGKICPDDLDVFAARFRQLDHLMLQTGNMSSARVVLESIEPSTVTTLAWDTKDFDYQEVECSLDKFVSLESLDITGTALKETLIASLSKLTPLTAISVLNGSPSPSNVLLLLDPLIRPPALQSLDVWPPCCFEFDDQLQYIAEFDPTKHGLVRPLWERDWTVQLAREVVSLAAQEGIRLGGAEGWAKSIALTEADLEARGDASDSHEDGSTASDIGSGGEEGSGSEDGS